MKSAMPLLLTGLIGFVTATYGQTSNAPSTAPAPTVTKDCKGLETQAKAECLKVARQMERNAAAPHDPTSTTPESNGPSSETVHHSSPVMQTPEEKKAASKSTAPPK